MRLYLTCPHQGYIRPEIFALKDSLQRRFRATGWQLVWDPVEDRPTMGCRNRQVHRFLSTNCDLFLTLDSDCVPERKGKPDVDGSLALLSCFDDPDVGAAGGWSLILDEPRGALLPCVVKAKGSNAARPHEWPLDLASPYSSVPVHDVTGGGIGTHCLAVRRDVFEAARAQGRIWFEDLYCRDPGSEMFGCRIQGHDLGFCRLVADLGYRVVLHNRVYWGHRKEVDLRMVHDALLDMRQRLEDAAG